jgi:hypothetical protein
VARRALIPLAECGLLSRTNARRYCGCLGEESFDRVIGPHVTPRLIGRARFYVRKGLDAWIEGIEQSNRKPLLEAIERVYAKQKATLPRLTAWCWLLCARPNGRGRRKS